MRFFNNTVIVLFSFCLFSTITTVSAQNSELNNLRDRYIKSYSPEFYGTFKKAEKAMFVGREQARILSKSISSYQGLVQTTDPTALLNDFNGKMREIQSIESNYRQQNTTTDIKTGINVANSLLSGNTQGALTQGLGYLAGAAERKRAEQELQAKKDALLKQRNAQMSRIYKDALALNRSTRKEYMAVAAYSENETDEKYNLEFAQNLECFENHMQNTYSPSHSNWLVNNCPKPYKTTSRSIQNNLISEAERNRQIAQRKYDIYERTGHEEFFEVAIAYSAAAISAEPNAENFYQLGTFYEKNSPILALSNYTVAGYYDEQYFKDSFKARKLETLRNEVRRDFITAVENNDIQYLNAVMAAELDKTLVVRDVSILNYVIQQDKPDAVQIVLNKYVEDQNKEEKQLTIRRAVMLCAVNNSEASLKKLTQLGISTDFNLEGNTPIDVAENAESMDALLVLIENSDGLENEKYESVYLMAERTGSLSILRALLYKPINPDLKTEVKLSIEQLDKEAYQRAYRLNTVTAYNIYLDEFPNGSSSQKAREYVADFEEESAYQKAKSTNLASNYENYLRKYPTGKYSIESKHELSAIYYTEGTKAFNEKKWAIAKKFFDGYIITEPTGLYAAEASKKSKIAGKKMNTSKTYSSIQVPILITARGGFGIGFAGLTKTLLYEKILIEPTTGTAGQYGVLFSIGLTQRIAAPVWLYAGAGAEFMSLLGEELLTNADGETLPGWMWETGAYIKVGNRLTLKYGIFMWNGVGHEFGISWGRYR
ncbi:MAG: hypothetical protein JXR07_08225 [Reichenbachiella sp.]